MKVKTARKRLKKLIRKVNDDAAAIEIVGKHGQKAVLISVSQYKALSETSYLLRSPDLLESLRRAGARDQLLDDKRAERTDQIA
ncbi:type II toxin-antitoxin system Phd/YefM family antitoxin [Rhodococcus sp. NPDC058514]|uniref:type II toxin-antitoxin system Phd/YefM family antitoxin n=1 Tax=unclassified Rhodococcus (in: high G+C Gram-positive bacteria) TaxID=192944 RepID=UPI0036682572